MLETQFILSLGEAVITSAYHTPGHQIEQLQNKTYIFTC